MAPPRNYQPHDDDVFLPEDKPTGAPSASPIPRTLFLKAHFFEEGRLTERQALLILEEATRIFSLEPNLLEIFGNTAGSSFLSVTDTETDLPYSLR